PFEYQQKSFFIPEENSECLQVEIPVNAIHLLTVAISQDENERDQYVEIIKNTITTIRRKNSSKIVISRSKDFPLTKFKLAILIRQLFSAYPTAFRYIWYHPKTGIWCGATPEV